MSRIFELYAPDGNLIYCKPMVQKRCLACSSTIWIGPYCETHLKQYLSLSIRPSRIKNSGLGVFACSTESDVDLTFKKGDILGILSGDIIDSYELELMYGDNTAPYTFKIDENQYIDGATNRCVFNMINHSIRNNVTCYNDGFQVFVECVEDIFNGEELVLNYGDEYWAGHWETIQTIQYSDSETSD